MTTKLQTQHNVEKCQHLEEDHAWYTLAFKYNWSTWLHYNAANVVEENIYDWSKWLSADDADPQLSYYYKLIF